MTSTYPPQTLELQQLPHPQPFAVDDDNDPEQHWREAYHVRLNDNTDPIPQLEQQTDKVNH